MVTTVTPEQLDNLARIDIIKKLDDLVLKQGSLISRHPSGGATHTVRVFEGNGLKVEAETGMYYFGDGNFYTVTFEGRRVFYASDKRDPYHGQKVFRCTARDIGESEPSARDTQSNKKIALQEPPFITSSLERIFIHEYSEGTWEERVEELSKKGKRVA